MLKHALSNIQIKIKRAIKDVQHVLGHKNTKATQLHCTFLIEFLVGYEGAEL